MRVTIYIRIKRKDGSNAFERPAKSGNNRLKPLYALVKGKPEHHPEGIYYLRYRRDGRNVWESVGSSEDEVVTLALKRELGQMPEAPAAVPPPSAFQPITPPDDKRHSILHSIRTYLTEKKAHRSHRTYLAYSLTWEQFLRFLTLPQYKDELSYGEYTLREDASKDLTPVAPAHLSVHYLEEITRETVLNFILFMKDHDSDDRTRYNRTTHVLSIFHHFEMKPPVRKGDKPTFVARKAQAYSESMLERMFAAATEDETDLLLFFLCVGLRDQEVMYACWPDLDLDMAAYTVTKHPDLGFIPKDKEEGTIPLPPNLVERLRARRKRYPQSRLIFPRKDGNPDGHLLRIIKRLALCAGVNCGHCVNKKGQSCQKHPVCQHIILHKLRKTFAGMMHNNGEPARSIQAMLRHSDLSTTLGYLPLPDESETRKRSAETFGKFGVSRTDVVLSIARA